jgi:hypothetical protein
VATGGRNLQGALCLTLAANGAEVELGLSRRRRCVAHGADQRPLSAQKLDTRLQRWRPEHLEPIGERCLRRVVDGDHQPLDPDGGKAPCHRQDAGDRPHRGVERELTDEADAVEQE